MKRIIPSILLCLFACSISNGQNPEFYIDKNFQTAGTFNDFIRKIIALPDGKFIVAGNFTKYKTTTNKGICRILADGTPDPTFTKEVTQFINGTVSDAVLQPDNKIIVAGSFSYTSLSNVVYKNIMRITYDGQLDESFNPGTGSDNTINDIALQSDGKIMVGGYFSTFNNVGYNGLVRLNDDGSIDNTINFGTAASGGFVMEIEITANGKYLIAGNFNGFNGTTRNGFVRLNTDGSVDNSFALNMGNNSYVYSPKELPDGKILVGGYLFDFSNNEYYIGRFNPDGTIDNSFSNSNFDNRVSRIRPLPNGQLLVSGDFSQYGSTIVPGFARLNSDGTLDGGFNLSNQLKNYGTVADIAVLQDNNLLICGPTMESQGYLYNSLIKLSSSGVIDNTFNRSPGLDGYVRALALQNDGKILVGGYIRSYSGSFSGGIQRINPDGDLDNSFITGTGADTVVECIQLQNNNKILIGGAFKKFNGITVNRFTRLNSNGSIDNSFNTGTGFDSVVYDIKTTPDNKIIVVGRFAQYNGSPAPRIIKLNADGTRDVSFNPGSGTDLNITKLLLQPDGKIICIGEFKQYNGTACKKIIRLNPNGSLDNTFSLAGIIVGGASTLDIQPDGKILVGGYFTYSKMGNFVSTGIIRLNDDGTVDLGFNMTSYLSTPLKIQYMPDGKIMVVGQFYSSYILRLNSDGTFDTNYFQLNQIVFDAGMFSFVQTADGSLVVGGYAMKFLETRFHGIIKIRYNKPGFNNISGTAIQDNNEDCNYQITDFKKTNQLICLLPGPQYTSTDSDGNYTFYADTTINNYTVKQLKNSIDQKLLVSVCPSDEISVVTSNSNNLYNNNNFFSKVKDCSLLDVEVTIQRHRRCFRNYATIQYSNLGKADAHNAEIKVIMPKYVKAISSSPAWTSKQDSILIYQLPIIESGKVAYIQLVDSVVCGNESIRGLSQCLQVSISPKSDCEPESTDWDKSSIKVTGACANGLAKFDIKNAGSGNMADSSVYRIYVNDTLVFNGKFKLISGESLPISIPANGNVIRLEADQRPNHPGHSNPRATIEGCVGSTQSLSDAIRGLMNSVSHDEEDADEAIDCSPIVDSVDPNEKVVEPAGVTQYHYISPSEPLTYTVHFQNTGTDTAYYVKIVDTLDINLDASELSIGNASHPFTWTVSGSPQAVLTFSFDKINLPDSARNQLKSNGFIQYSIRPDLTKSLGTEIKNKAYIYFDYNSPIITNETSQITGMPILTNFAKGSQVTVGTVVNGVETPMDNSFMVFPNPVENVLNVQLNDTKKITLVLYRADGSIVRKGAEYTKQVHWDISSLDQGLYLLEITTEDGNRQMIKLLKK